MAKEFFYRGKPLDQLLKMSLQEFAVLLNARERRKIKHGLTEQEKKLLVDMKSNSKDVKTHCRDMVILPEMVGKLIKVYNGKDWTLVELIPEMLGHRLGEYSQTRRQVKHSAPGIGATRSSASLSVR